MAKIHGAVYALLGIFVMAVSWKINPGKFILFIYVGFVLFAVGIGKLVMSAVSKKKFTTDAKGYVELSTPRVYSRHHQSGSAGHTPSHGTYHPHSAAHHASPQQGYHHCFRCGAVVSGHDRYCRQCGAQLVS